MSKRFFVVAAFLIAALCALGGCASSGASSAASPADSSASAEAAASADPFTYTVVRANGDIDWSTIPQLDVDNVQWTDDYGIRAHAQLCYDDRALYVRMWAEEQDIRAEHQKDEVNPSCYEDSCLEFFFMPTDDDRYLNFEFNPNCAVCAEIGTQKTDRTALVPRDDVYNAMSFRTDDGWEIRYELPFEFLQELYPVLQPASGVQLRANFYKCGNLTAHKHYLSWKHVDSETPNFHQPESFGTLIFE